MSEIRDGRDVPDVPAVPDIREDLDVREALEKAGIAIFVGANNNGQVLVTYRNKTVRRDAQRARQEAEQLEREATISDKDKAGRAAALDTIEDQL